MSTLVSVVMPVYNGGEFISQAIQSILNQSYTEIELIIVDDCSTDDTSEIVKSFSFDKRVRYYKLDSNSGSPCAPRNYGVKVASGQYVAFLDADDFWASNKIRTQLEFMISNNIVFSCSGYKIVDRNGDVLSIYTPPEQFGYKELLKNNSVGCLTAMLSTSLVKKYIFPSCGHEDFALWLEICREEGIQIHSISSCLASYRKVDGSVSSSKYKMVPFFWNIYRNRESLGVLRSMFYCFLYFSNVIWFKYK